MSFILGGDLKGSVRKAIHGSLWLSRGYSLGHQQEGENVRGTLQGQECRITEGAYGVLMMAA